MKAFRILGLVAVGAAVVTLAGVGRPESAGGAQAPSGGIKVTGSGSVDSVPDEAAFTIGVQTKGSTAREALSAGSQQMRKVLAALRSAGVAGRDAKTQNVSVSPSYSQGGQIDGYWAGNSVGVTIRDLAKAGAILDAASEAGADEIDGPSWTRSDRDALEARALRDAVADARTKARVLADAGGVQLGRLTAITEHDSEPEPYYMRTSLLAKDSPAPLRPGKEKIEATITVTFAVD